MVSNSGKQFINHTSKSFRLKLFDQKRLKIYLSKTFTFKHYSLDNTISWRQSRYSSLCWFWWLCHSAYWNDQKACVSTLFTCAWSYPRFYIFYNLLQAKIPSYILAVSIPSNLCYSRWRNSRRKCHIWIYYWSWSLSSWYYFKSTTKFNWGREFFIRLISFQPAIEITTTKKIFSGNGKSWCSS